MNKQTGVKILYLSQEDMISCGVLNMNECVKAIEEGFKIMGSGDYLFGGPDESEHGIKLWFPKQSRGKNMPTMGPDRRFMAMVGYIGGEFNICGVKWYGSNNTNPKERGLPRSIHIVILNDVLTGLPLVIMEGALLSAMRTGATLGVAAKYLSKKDVKIAGVLGAGVISKACIISLASVLQNLKEVKVFDIDKNKAKVFAKEMSEELGLNVYTTDTCEETIKETEVISVNVSGKNPPLIKDQWLKQGCLLLLPSSIGENTDIYINNILVADLWKQHLNKINDQDQRHKIEPSDNSHLDFAATHVVKLIKDKKIEEKNILHLHDIVTGRKKGRNNEKEKILFLCGGLPMQDLAWGFKIYQNALKKNIGKKLSLWEKPYWI